MDLFEVSVGNLQPSVTMTEVEQHFSRLFWSCQPRASALTSSPDSNNLYTAFVTFDIPSTERLSIQDVLARINISVIQDGSTNAVSQLQATSPIRGLNVLAQAPSSPEFDVIFVHGQDSSLTKSFAATSTRQSAPTLWPRDVLPVSLNGSRQYGRYLFFGYSLNNQGSQEIRSSITDIGKTLISEIVRHRPKVSQRPIFFVCHGAGGLVVCHALVLALGDQKNSTVTQKLRQDFAPNGFSPVRGITFFGSPSKGFEAHRAVSDPILVAFNDLSRQLGHQMNLLMFTERKEKSFLRRFMGKENNEQSTELYNLGESLSRVRLNRDFDDLCRLSCSKDDLEWHRKVFPSVRDHIALGLNNTQNMIGNSGSGPQTKSDPRSGHGSGSMRVLTQREGKPLWTAKPYDLTVDLESATHLPKTDSTIAHILGFYDYSNHIETIAEHYEGTCEWILEENSFKGWIDAPTDSCLLLRGGLGMGKSVLSRFVFEHLAKVQTSNHTIAVACFCDEDRPFTPVDGLRHVMFQLWKAFPDEVTEARKRWNHVRGSDFKFTELWDIFVETRRAIKTPFTLFWIQNRVDGRLKDAYGRSSKFTDVQPPGGFLEFMCRFFTTERTNLSSTVKVLTTARPNVDIAQIVSTFPDLVVLDVGALEIELDLTVFIDNEVANFCKQHHLGEDYNEFIKKELIAHNGWTFRWPQVILQKINVLDNFKHFEKIVQDMQPPDVSANYLVQFKEIAGDPRVSAKDKKSIGWALRIMGASFARYPIEDLSCAVACATNELQTQKESSRILLQLDTLMRSYCGGVMRFDKDSARITHPSVSKFFMNLSPLEWPDFSWADTQGEDARMSLICLGYLDHWFKLSIPQSLYASNSFSLIAQHVKGPFVKYCVQNWHRHIKALKSMDIVWDMVSQFLLHPSETSYRLLLVAYKVHSEEEVKWEEWEVPPVEEILAHYNLDNVIEKALDTRASQNASSQSQVFPWLHRTTNRAVPMSLDLSAVNFQGSSMLYSAALMGAIDTMALLIQHGARGDITNKRGRTPLWAACSSDHEAAAVCLINSSQAFFEEIDSTQISTLQFAVVRGMDQIVNWILTVGGKSSNDTTGLLKWTPLYVGCEYGQTQIVLNMLNNFGADPSVKARDGSNALHAAARKGRLDLLKAMIELRPELEVESKDNKDLSLLHYAASAGQLDTFSFLYDRTPVVTLPENRWTPMHDAASSGHLDIVKYIDKDQLEIRTRIGLTPLHVAAEKDRVDVMRYLLECGVDINPKYETPRTRKSEPPDVGYYVTPLVRALEMGSFKAIELLLSREEIDLNITNLERRNLLHIAAAYTNLDVVKQLYKCGLDPYATDKHGFTAHFTAADKGKEDVLKFLVELSQEKGNFDVHHRSELGASLMLLSVASGKMSTVKYVQSLGGDIQDRDLLGCSILHYAADNKETDNVMEYLLELLAHDVNTPNRYGYTPLHASVSHGNLSTLKILLKHGADINAQNRHGFTALILAVVKDKKEIVEELLTAGADTTIRDCFGETAMDKIFQETCEVFEPFRSRGLMPARWRRSTKQSATASRSLQERMEIESGLRKRLKDFIQSLASMPALPPDHLYFDAARINQLIRGLMIKDQSEFLVLRELSIVRLRSGETWFRGWCDICLKDRWKGTMHTCKECYDVDLCQKCYEDHASGKNPLKKCDPKHEYFVAGGEDWWARPEGIVNDAGETVEEFMERLKTKYCDDRGFDSSPAEVHASLIQGEIQSE